MRNALLLILLILAVGLTGCSDDDPVKTVFQPPSAYKPLDKRDNLLYNLERAYTLRDFEEFGKILDSSGAFIFHFGQDDIDRGIAAVPQWDSATELTVTEALFDQNPPTGRPYAGDIVLELTYTEGEDEWEPFVPNTHPQETWYKKTVSYRLAVRIGLTTHTQDKDVFAEFAARFTEAQGDSIWQIVTWRDDVPAPPGVMQITGGQTTSGKGSDTWGIIKQVFGWELFTTVHDNEAPGKADAPFLLFTNQRAGEPAGAISGDSAAPPYGLCVP